MKYKTTQIFTQIITIFWQSFQLLGMKIQAEIKGFLSSSWGSVRYLFVEIYKNQILSWIFTRKFFKNFLAKPLWETSSDNLNFIFIKWVFLSMHFRIPTSYKITVKLSSYCMSNLIHLLTVIWSLAYAHDTLTHREILSLVPISRQKWISLTRQFFFHFF